MAETEENEPTLQSLPGRMSAPRGGRSVLELSIAFQYLPRLRGMTNGKRSMPQSIRATTANDRKGPQPTSIDRTDRNRPQPTSTVAPTSTDRNRPQRPQSTSTDLNRPQSTAMDRNRAQRP
mmetsp:Transcript_12055/g.24928  ORF Transcript_12055/g.24928 Transcript_12055/m.24928 type:complete len:121 (+) Transcript_12055:83-445(+)